MIFCHKDYLTYELPNEWCSEEEKENLIIYNPNGEGAITISFFSILEMKDTLDEQISIMAVKFINQNQITLHNSLILCDTKDNKKILCGAGITSNNWFIKLWIVAKYPKIVFATYLCERKTLEVKKCDKIIDSFKFLF